MRPGEGPVARGVTLVELMLGTVILAIVMLIGTRLIQDASSSVFASRTQTVAHQLATDRLEATRSQPFSLIPTATEGNVQPIPGLPADPLSIYDAVNYPVETRRFGGTEFQLYSLIQKVDRNGVGESIQVVASTVPETGLRRMIQTILWTEGGRARTVQVVSLIENQRRASPIYEITGLVCSTTAVPLPATWVSLWELPTIKTVTDNTGRYTLRAPAGTYTVAASRVGYTNTTSTGVVLSAANSPKTCHLNMPAITSGTITGSAWKVDHPVICNVMGSSTNAAGFSQEWVRIYLPSGQAPISETQLKLKFQRKGSLDPSPLDIDIDYSPAGGAETLLAARFYLFANTSPVTINGSTMTPNAVWKVGGGLNEAAFPYFSTARNIIPVVTDGAGEGAGGIGLYSSTGTLWDKVGWEDADCAGGPGVPLVLLEGTPALHGACTGLRTGEQIFRRTKPGVYISTQGPAFDSGDNDRDTFSSLTLRTSTGNFFSYSGTPAPGALIYPSGGVRSLARAASGGLSQATFTLTAQSQAFGVTVTASTGTMYGSYTVASLAAGGTAGPIDVIATPQYSASAFLSGTLYDTYGSPLGVPIPLRPQSGEGYVGPDGSYLAIAYSGLTGANTLALNRDDANPDYVEQRPGVTCPSGQACQANLTYQTQYNTFQGNVVVGNGAPRPDAAIQVDYLDWGTSKTILTNGNGTFTLKVASGTFRLSPVPGPDETCYPASYTKTFMSVGATDTVTFTINAGYRPVTGRATWQNAPVATGALVMFTTATVSGFPVLDTTERNSSGRGYYTGVTRRDGSFSVNVRPGLTYNVYGWYTQADVLGTTTTQKAFGTVTVPAGVSAFDAGELAWP